eukprot:6201428-Pleurochrysis_carterae.AAC.1
MSARGLRAASQKHSIEAEYDHPWLRKQWLSGCASQTEAPKLWLKGQTLHTFGHRLLGVLR